MHKRRAKRRPKLALQYSECRRFIYLGFWVDTKVATPQVMAMTEVKSSTAHKDNLALDVGVLLNINQRAGISHQIVMQHKMIDEEGEMIPLKEETSFTEAGLVQGKDQNKTGGKMANSSLQQLLQTVIEHLMTDTGKMKAVLDEEKDSCKDCRQQQE